MVPGDSKRIGFPGIKSWIGGGWIERAPIKLHNRTIPLLVDEEGLLKNLQANVVASILYHNSHIAGEAVIPIGKTGWGY